MKKGIYSQAVILSSLLFTFVLAGGLSYLYGTRSEKALASSLRLNILMLDRLPELRGGVREMELLTELYLETGESGVLERRRRAVSSLMERYAEFKSFPAAQPLDKALARFDRSLRAFLDLQRGMLRSTAAARADLKKREALRAGRDELLEIISTFGDRSARKLSESAILVQRTSMRLYVVRLLFEIALSISAAWYLFFFILRPLRAVEEIAGGWKLGSPWPGQTLSSIPEIRGLITHFGEMAERLNGEFAKVERFSGFKTKLVSVVSHEFGNALMVMKGAVFLLKEGLPKEGVEENGRLLDMLGANIVGLTSAARNLLDLGRHEAGELAVDFAPTDVCRILLEVRQRLGLLFEKKKLRVELACEAGLAPAKADQAALALVLSNFASNSVKYTPDGGRVILGVERESGRPGFCRVFVRDSGIGLSEKEAGNILGGTAYYRTEGGRAMASQGLGIGLSLSKLIIESHGSVLELQSRPGKGSCFSFLLPLYEREAAREVV